MKLLKKVNNTFDHFIDYQAYLAAALLFFIMIAVTYDITVRFIFNSSLTWLTEISEYLLVYIAFLSGAWALKKEAHVKMDLIINQLKPTNQALVNFITSIIGVFTCLTIAWYGTVLTWEYIARGETRETILYLPKWPLFIIIPIGGYMLVIQFIKRARGYYGKISEKVEDKTVSYDLE